MINKNIDRKIDKIVDWLNKKLKESGQQGFVFGLSGGVDSAVVAALALRVTKNVIGIIMPCYSNSSDMKDAYAVSRKLKLKIEEIDLTEVYDSFIKILPVADKLTTANLKPRLRMATLYHFAGANKYLVLGTGNKSELSIGYFTKYGDGGSDLLPIGSLLKREVYAFAEKLCIPKSVIIKPPSAGLWENQTDETEMGITYEQLDAVLSADFGKNKSLKIEKKIIDKIKIMYKNSEHKRKLTEICKI